MDSRVVALCYVLCAACAPEAGTARVVFTFTERPVLAVDGRPVDVTLTLAVEERTEAARRSLGSSSVSWPAGVTPESAEVPAISVPHGRARVVVMTLALVGGGLLGVLTDLPALLLIVLVGAVTVAFGMLFYRHARGLWTSILYLTGSIFED